MVAHGLPTLYALDSVHKFKALGFWPLKSPRESISDAQIMMVLYLLDIYIYIYIHLSTCFGQ